MRMLLQPLRDEGRIVSKRQVFHFRSQLSAKRRKLGGETPVSLIYLFPTRHNLSRQISEKIPHDMNDAIDLPAVRTGIVS